MHQDFKAIFEGGVLRPLTPVSFHDREVVHVSASSATDESTDASEIQRQNDVLLKFVARMEAEGDEADDDGLSNRDHDRIIYGDG